MMNYFFQPIVGDGNRVIYWEMLLRPVVMGERVSPDAFIARTEANGVSAALDLDFETFRHMLELRREFPTEKFGMNISGLTASNPEWMPRTLEALRRDNSLNCQTAAHLVVEITETAPMTDLDQAARFTKRFQDLDGHVAADDVGANGERGRQWTRATLFQIRPDILKIDRDRTDNLPMRGRQQAAFREWLEMGKKSGSLVVAEGVETERTARYLTGIGVHAMQGFWFGVPVDGLRVEPSRRHRPHAHPPKHLVAA